MRGRHAELFDTIREDVLKRLVEVRSSIDHAYARLPEEMIREQFGVVLDKMSNYLVTGDAQLYRSFANRWLAMRTGQGFSPENIIHSVVAIGHVVADVAKARLGSTPEFYSFARAMAQLNFAASRMLVDLLADELGRRSEQYQQLSQQNGDNTIPEGGQ